MKRKISKSDYYVLQRELSHLKDQGYIEKESLPEMLSLYEPKGKIPFFHALLVVGSLFMGGGVLSFIAGNWSALPNTAKFLILLLSLIGFYSGAWMAKEKYPKTSKSLFYVGASIYGAGIFLISQMFHLSMDHQSAFLLWAIGIIPIVWSMKDKLVLLFVILFLGIYGLEFDSIIYESFSYPIALLVLLPFLYWMNHYRLNKSKIGFLFLTALAMELVLMNLLFFNADELVITLLFFVIGIMMVSFPFQSYKRIMEWIGSIIYGICGMILTFGDVWYSLAPESHDGIAIVFTILFGLYLLWMLQKGSLPSILIVSSLIFRFYVDISYDFLPKSLFFLISGGLMILFGYWFEKTRRGERK